MGNPQRWYISWQTWQADLSIFRSCNSSHPSTVHQHNAARYLWQMFLFWAYHRTAGVQNGGTNLLLPRLWPWSHLCALCWLLQKLWTRRTQVFWKLRTNQRTQFDALLGTRWAQVWEVGIVIVETLRPGKSTPTVPPMYLAHRSCCLWILMPQISV